MKINDIISSVAKELDLPEDIVLNTYKAYWSFIKDTIENLPLKEDLSEEEFNSFRTNFNIPSIGKLHCTYDRFCYIKERFDLIQKIKNKNNENQKD